MTKIKKYLNLQCQSLEYKFVVCIDDMDNYVCVCVCAQVPQGTIAAPEGVFEKAITRRDITKPFLADKEGEAFRRCC